MLGFTFTAVDFYKPSAVKWITTRIKFYAFLPTWPHFMNYSQLIVQTKDIGEYHTPQEREIKKEATDIHR